MKTFLLVPLLLAAAAGLCRAQNSGDGLTIRNTTTIHPDGTRSTTIVDPEKSTAEETVADASGKVMRKVTYLLDERGEAIGSITYDPKGNVLYRATYKRDGMDRVDEEDISSAEGRLMRRRLYTYGAQNKVINVVEYDGDGNIVSSPHPTPSSRRRK